MKFFNQNNLIPACALSVLFLGIGFLLCNIYWHQDKRIQSDLNALKLDTYTAQAFLTSLVSAKTYNEFSIEDFVECALQDQYKRINSSISFLEEQNGGIHGNDLRSTLAFLKENREQIERYWLKNGKFDCESIGWKN